MRLVKVLFMTFGWIILLLLVVHWIVPIYAIQNQYGNADPNVRYDTFKGFSWFFNQLGRFPAFDPFIKGMQQWSQITEINIPSSEDIKLLKDISTGLSYVVTALKYMVYPFVGLGLIVYNIALLLIWLIGFFAFI